MYVQFLGQRLCIYLALTTSKVLGKADQQQCAYKRKSPIQLHVIIQRQAPIHLTGDEVIEREMVRQDDIFLDVDEVVDAHMA